MIPRLALKALRQNVLRTALTMLGTRRVKPPGSIRSRPCDPNEKGRVMRVFLSAAFVALAGTQSPSAQEPLTLVGSIDLPRVEGRIDHLAFDAAGQRLFVAAHVH